MTKVKEILVLHHSHLDVGYTHPQSVLWELQRDYIDEAMDLCEKTADWPEESRFRWTCEATAPVLKWLESASGRDIERFEQLVKAQQICIAAMNMHTSPLCTAEQLARMLYPVRDLRSRFSLALNTAINHDINGQPWALSQILLDAGIQLYITGVNTHFGGIPMIRPRAFWWEAPDGRRLLNFLGEHYSMFTQICKSWENNTEVMAEGLNRYLKRLEEEEYPFDFIYLTSTNIPMLDNTPPDHQLSSLIQTWNEEGREQRIRFTTPELLLQRLNTLDLSAIPVARGDWTDFWNFGAASSAMETRLNRRTKHALQTVEFIEAFEGPAIEQKRQDALKHEAWNNANLYDEHTWGASESITQPDSIQTALQWTTKSHYAVHANGVAAYLYGKQLEAFAANALQSDGLEGLLLVNPTQAPQQCEVRIPSVYTLTGRHLSADRLRYYRKNEDGSEEEVSCGSVEVAPFSWRVIPFGELTPQTEAAGITVSTGCIESPYYRLRFDSETGAILELVDKSSGWNVVDGSSGWGLFGFVRESVDGDKALEHRRTLFDRDIDKCNNSISCWNHAWPPKREGTTRLKSCDVKAHAGGVTLRLCYDAPGVENLEQSITLFAHRPGIEFSASFHKLDIRTPESVYFAFPLRLRAGWQAVFDSADNLVRLDDDQLPRVSRDWVTVDKTVSIFDGENGVTLACPDAPLVQIGGFRFGMESAQIERDENPLLVAWPLTNYWDTNFRASQPGHITVKYELSTFRQFQPEVALNAGLTAINPVDIWPLVSCSQGKSGTLLAVDGEGLAVTHVKPAEDGRGIILRVRNHGHQSVKGNIQFPNRIVAEAYRTTGLEENRTALQTGANRGSVQATFEPGAFETIRVVLE